MRTGSVSVIPVRKVSLWVPDCEEPDRRLSSVVRVPVSSMDPINQSSLSSVSLDQIRRPHNQRICPLHPSERLNAE